MGKVNEKTLQELEGSENVRFRERRETDRFKREQEFKKKDRKFMRKTKREDERSR